MSLMKIIALSSTAVSAQAQRLNVVASNLANADSVAGPDGQAYKSRQVVFQTRVGAASDPTSGGVKVRDIVEDGTPGKQVYDPKSPMANDQGYVTQSNVNVVEEMVNMISASRSYQNNVEIMNTAQQLLLKTLQIGS